MGAFADRLRECMAVFIFFAAGSGQLASQTVLSHDPKPLPDPATYLQAASDKEDAFADIRQQYLCVFKNTKQIAQKARLYESFYIHGHEIQRLLEFNGVPLSPQQKQAEEARVEAEIAADQKKPVAPFIGLAGGMYFSSGEHRWAQTVEGSIVRAARFTNETRGMYRGRLSIQINFVGNKEFTARTDEERVAKVLAGYFIVDEESGAVVRVKATATEDAAHGKVFVRQGAEIGFDTTRIADNLYLPSSWTNTRWSATPIVVPGHPPRMYAEIEDFWLQSCRRYTGEVQVLPGATPVQ